MMRGRRVTNHLAQWLILHIHRKDHTLLGSHQRFDCRALDWGLFSVSRWPKALIFSRKAEEMNPPTPDSGVTLLMHYITYNEFIFKKWIMKINTFTIPVEKLAAAKSRSRQFFNRPFRQGKGKKRSLYVIQHISVGVAESENIISLPHPSAKEQRKCSVCWCPEGVHLLSRFTISKIQNRRSWTKQGCLRSEWHITPLWDPKQPYLACTNPLQKEQHRS